MHDLMTGTFSSAFCVRHNFNRQWPDYSDVLVYKCKDQADLISEIDIHDRFQWERSCGPDCINAGPACNVQYMLRSYEQFNEP